MHHHFDPNTVPQWWIISERRCPLARRQHHDRQVIRFAARSPHTRIRLLQGGGRAERDEALQRKRCCSAISYITVCWITVKDFWATDQWSHDAYMKLGLIFASVFVSNVFLRDIIYGGTNAWRPVEACQTLWFWFLLRIDPEYLKSNA